MSFARFGTGYKIDTTVLSQMHFSASDKAGIIWQPRAVWKIFCSPKGSWYKLKYTGNSKNICLITIEGRGGTAHTKNGPNTPCPLEKHEKNCSPPPPPDQAKLLQAPLFDGKLLAMYYTWHRAITKCLLHKCFKSLKKCLMPIRHILAVSLNAVQHPVPFNHPELFLS